MVAIKKTKKKKSRARLDAFTRGVIWGMHLGKLKREEMQKHLAKKDGTRPTLGCIDKVIGHKTADPDWRGEESRAGGRPHALSDKEKKLLVNLVFKHRGQAIVTVNYCRRKLKFLKKVGLSCVECALHEAGLAWLGRRQKSWVPRLHKEARLAYCRWLKARHQQTLDRLAYTDGTTWFLAVGPSDADDKKRVALGSRVWRMASGKDGLFDDNISPSLYAKAQGKPIKIWGFLANGRLEYWVLPEDYDAPKYKSTNMNGDRYNDLVNTRFVQWRQKCFRDDKPCRLVQDHEKCLWQDRNLQALQAAGCNAVDNFPKSSPDLNAIEGVWRLLKDRVLETAPKDMETRAEFLARLGRQVQWLNDVMHDHLLELCTNQKERGLEIEELLGTKCKW